MIGTFRNRLAWRLRRLADRVEYHEPECRHIDPETGRRCGFWREGGMHGSALGCTQDGVMCDRPDEHHEFVR